MVAKNLYSLSLYSTYKQKKKSIIYIYYVHIISTYITTYYYYIYRNKGKGMVGSKRKGISYICRYFCIYRKYILGVHIRGKGKGKGFNKNSSPRNVSILGKQDM